jgi:type IV secretory pathway VirB10-like protein
MTECLNVWICLLLITYCSLLITHYSLPIAFREGNEAQKSTAGFSRKSRERYHERQETETTIVAGWKSLSSAIGKLPAPTASQTPETLEAALSAPTTLESESPAAEPIPVQLKENSLTHRLQAPDKEATVRFTVDMSESLHRKLSMLAARTGRKKVDIVRMLLEDGLSEVES